MIIFKRLLALTALLTLSLAGSGTASTKEWSNDEVRDFLKENDNGKKSIIVAYVEAGYRSREFSGFEGWISLPTAKDGEITHDSWAKSGKIFWSLVPRGNYILGDLYRGRSRYHLRKRGTEAVRVPVKKSRKVYYAGGFTMVEDANSYDLIANDDPTELEVLEELLPIFDGLRYERDLKARIKRLKREAK